MLFHIFINLYFSKQTITACLLIEINDNALVLFNNLLCEGHLIGTIALK